MICFSKDGMSKATLLLVDDDASIRRLCSRMLSRLGLNMLEAVNGKDGLSRLKNGEDVQAVLLDVNLPDGTGTDWAEKIQNERPDLPVIFFTGNVSPKSNTIAGRHYLPKPFTKDILKEVLGRAVPDLF